MQELSRHQMELEPASLEIPEPETQVPESPGASSHLLGELSNNRPDPCVPLGLHLSVRGIQRGMEDSLRPE